jgi:NADH:ubiquinone oxidoreductase subunit B-like Fe-S oxidoreductase
VAKKEGEHKLRSLILGLLRPLNIFQIHGTLCCHKMAEIYKRDHFTDNFFCYQALSFEEANVLVIWGSLSKKLSHLLSTQVEVMLKNRCILHIRGCKKRIDNEFSSSSLTNYLPINMVFSDCSLNKKHFDNLILGARECLKV